MKLISKLPTSLVIEHFEGIGEAQVYAPTDPEALATQTFQFQLWSTFRFVTCVLLQSISWSTKGGVSMCKTVSNM